MALIIYPDDSYDSFISVADCTSLSDNYIADNKFATLADDNAREVILRQTALQIRQCPSIVLPDTAELDLEMAQVYLVEHALTVNMISYDPTSESITGETVGEIAVTYDVNRKDGNDSFSPMVQSLLSQYGCTSSTNGFSMANLGRS